MNSVKNILKPLYGLFEYKWPYLFENIRDLPHMFHRLRFFFKHGYSETATYETFNHFIKMYREILINYRDNHTGVPNARQNPAYEVDLEKREKAYIADLNRMLELLDLMDETKSNKECIIIPTKEMEEAKNNFFEMFSKYFYYLWD